MLLEGASVLVDVIGQCGEPSAIMEISSSMVEGFTETAFKETKSLMVVGLLKMLAEGSAPTKRMPMIDEFVGPFIVALLGPLLES